MTTAEKLVSLVNSILASANSQQCEMSMQSLVGLREVMLTQENYEKSRVHVGQKDASAFSLPPPILAKRAFLKIASITQIVFAQDIRSDNNHNLNSLRKMTNGLTAKARTNNGISIPTSLPLRLPLSPAKNQLIHTAHDLLIKHPNLFLAAQRFRSLFLFPIQVLFLIIIHLFLLRTRDLEQAFLLSVVVHHPLFYFSL
ncbi:hypothetical protein BT69DRAFT_140256 [Atractiella rhizophila]|nr:hypothetical protein BT69DRAFT_140256 [Atractiella rhizophila]